MAMPDSTNLTALSKIRNLAWLPALLLIFVQIASGMRDLPQFTFFLIYLQEKLEAAPVLISTLVAAAQLVGMATALFGGAITARLGSKWVMVCGLILSSVSSLVFWVHDVWVAAVLWLFSGAGLALQTVGGASYLTRISARGGLGTLAAFYALSMTVGGAVGNPLAGYLIERSGFTTFALVALSISAVTITIITLLLVSLPHLGPEPPPFRSFWSGILTTAREQTVRRLVGLRCVVTIFYGMISVIVPLLLNELSGSKVFVAAYGTASLVVASAAQLLTGRSADRWGALRPSYAAYAVVILASLGLAASTGSAWGIFVFGVLGIAAAWSLATLMYVWISDGIPSNEHPATFGLLHAVWSLSMISGSLLGSSFVLALPALPFILTGVINLAGFLLIRSYYSQVNRHR